MKKITINIPDDDRRFEAYKGRELIAFTQDGYLYQKKTSCNQCGECCMVDAPFPDEEGRCTYLTKRGDIYDCDAGNQVPLDCVRYDPSNEDYCCITHTRRRLK